MTTATMTRDVPFAEYLAIDALHFGALKVLDLSPLHYRHHLRAPREESEAMTLGRLVHGLVLSGVAPEDVAFYDGPVRRGKVWEAFAAEHAGKSIVLKSQMAAASAMHEAVMHHAGARELLSRGEPEVTLRWRAGRRACKGRIDWWTGEQIVELKTTRAIDPRTFEKECASRAYHAQLAFYSAGLAAARRREAPVLPALITVESAPPYDVCVYRVGFDVLEAGAAKVESWLSTLDRCEASGHWPGVDGGRRAVDLRLPEWATEGGEEPDFTGIGG